MEKKYNENETRRMYERITRALIQKGLTITTMESATSGQIASLITDTEGSSADTLEQYTVYSRETAAAMAKACRKTYGADIGIGVTGTMGNTDPANPGASVPGQVYFAIDFKGSVEAFFVELPPQTTRLGYKLAVAWEIGEVLKKLL